MRGELLLLGATRRVWMSSLCSTHSKCQLSKRDMDDKSERTLISASSTSISEFSTKTQCVLPQPPKHESAVISAANQQ